MDSYSINNETSEFSGVSSGELPSIINQLEPKIVAVDIFDTLIHRKVHPEDVKKIVAVRTLEAIYSPNLKWRDLYGFRNQLEREICLENVAKDRDMEFSFPCYCERLHNLLDEKGYFEKLPSLNRFSMILSDIELSVERSIQYSDTNVKNLLVQLHKRGVLIYFISDFYLPSTMLAEMLSWHGIKDCYQEILSSSDFLETKRTGKLYKRFLRAVNKPPELIVMVGDNEEADGKMAIKAGIKSICLDRSDRRSNYAEQAKSFSNKKLVFEKINCLFTGSTLFPELSLSLFNFTRKLYNRLLVDGVKDIFFLSREGQALKRMFDAYQKINQTKGSNYIKSHYFLASRRSTFLPSLEEFKAENFHVLFRQYRKISLKDFLLSLGLDDYLKTITQELEVDANFRESDFPTSNTFSRLLDNQLFIDTYENKRKQQKEKFIKYLESFDVDFASQGMALVDVGWKGSIQDNISRILEGLHSVKGYYLGILAIGAEKTKNNKTGILFSSLRGASKGFYVFRENTALFEVILAANHGSTSHYEEKNGVSYGVIEDFTLDAPLYENKIYPLLLELEERFREICNIQVRHPVDDDFLDSFVIKKHARMVYFPKLEELNWFASIYHRENFGLFGESDFSAEKSLTLIKRLNAFYRLVKAPRSFLEATFWPALKLKQEGLGFAILPYNKYRLFRQIRKGEF